MDVVIGVAEIVAVRAYAVRAYHHAAVAPGAGWEAELLRQVEAASRHVAARSGEAKP